MAVTERPSATPWLQQVREILDEFKLILDLLETEIERFREQWQRARNRGDNVRLLLLEPQRAEIRVKLSRVEDILKILDELKL